jgi:hypothetical protein
MGKVITGSRKQQPLLTAEQQRESRIDLSVWVTEARTACVLVARIEQVAGRFGSTFWRAKACFLQLLERCPCIQTLCVCRFNLLSGLSAGCLEIAVLSVNPRSRLPILSR